MIKWFTADPATEPSIHPDKLAVRGRTPEQSEEPRSAATPATPTPSNCVADVPSTPQTPLEQAPQQRNLPAKLELLNELGEAPLPPAIGTEAPRAAPHALTHHFPETSNGLTPSILRSRLASGKKLKGGMYLSPQEMEELSAHWRPYRSVACWFLWSLSDGDG